MTDRIFLDTNILVYAFDNSDPKKQQTAQNLLNSFFDEQEYYSISTQVISEFCSVVFKKFRNVLTDTDLQEFISSFSDEQIFPLTRTVLLKSLQIKQRFGLSLWDSQIVASALLSECKFLYSEDLADGQVIENLTILNPFK